MDEKGPWASVIESLLVEESELPRGREFEVVAISGARTSRKDQKPRYRTTCQYFDEMSRRIEINHRGVYEFYNVPWIERKQVLAYRKAVGRIRAHAWERQKLKDVDIIFA
jgi:hypothetical protein